MTLVYYRLHPYCRGAKLCPVDDKSVFINPEQIATITPRKTDDGTACTAITLAGHNSEILVHEDFDVVADDFGCLRR